MKTPYECIKWVELLYDAYPTTSEDFQDCMKCTKMYLGSFEQVQWERTLAIQQLNDYGKRLGEK